MWCNWERVEDSHCVCKTFYPLATFFRGDIVMLPFVCGWVSGFVALCLVDRIETTVFVQPLSHFMTKLLKMRGGTLLILSHVGWKVKVNIDTLSLKPCEHDADYSFVQSDSAFTHYLWMMRGGTLLILGDWVKGQGRIDTLYIAPCGHAIKTIVFEQSPSNFTHKLRMMREGTLLTLGHGVKGQGQIRHSVYKTLWARYRL